MQGLAGHGKEFEFYSTCNAKSLKDLKRRFSMVQVTFLKDHTGMMWRVYWGRGKSWRSIRKPLKSFN